MSLSAGREEQQTPAGAKMSLFHERQIAGPPFNSRAAAGPVGKLCVDVAAVVYTGVPLSGFATTEFLADRQALQSQS